MLTVVNEDGRFSGVQYKEIKQEYIDHHKQYGQKLIWLERKINQQVDEDGSPIVEIATEDELNNEITNEINEIEVLKNRVQMQEMIINELLTNIIPNLGGV